MEGATEVSDEAIFQDVSRAIGGALERCHHRSPARELIAATAFEIALGQLI